MLVPSLPYYSEKSCSGIGLNETNASTLRGRLRVTEALSKSELRYLTISEMLHFEDSLPGDRSNTHLPFQKLDPQDPFSFQ